MCRFRGRCASAAASAGRTSLRAGTPAARPYRRGPLHAGRPLRKPTCRCASPRSERPSGPHRSDSRRTSSRSARREVHRPQVRFSQYGVPQVGSGKMRPSDHDTLEIGPAQVGSEQVRALQIRSPQIRIRQIHILQVGFPEVALPQVRTDPVVVPPTFHMVRDRPEPFGVPGFGLLGLRECIRRGSGREFEVASTLAGLLPDSPTARFALRRVRGRIRPGRPTMPGSDGTIAAHGRVQA